MLFIILYLSYFYIVMWLSFVFFGKNLTNLFPVTNKIQVNESTLILTQLILCYQLFPKKNISEDTLHHLQSCLLDLLNTDQSYFN